MDTEAESKSSASSFNSDQCSQEVYEQLREVAQRYLRRERRDHTLQPTALIHEAYIRLKGQQIDRWRNQEHFCATAALMMRRILVNYARDRACEKRGGARQRLSLSVVSPQQGESRPLDLLALDEAMDRLSAMDPRQCRMVELRFFGGLSVAETARVLDVSERTILREWAAAQAWLRAELAETTSNDS